MLQGAIIGGVIGLVVALVKMQRDKKKKESDNLDEGMNEEATDK